MILHIPHASTFIPDTVRKDILLDDAELEEELLCMTDWHTDELFPPDKPDVTSIIYPVSRLVVDPERFLDDDKEPMAEKGMGVVYVQTSNGKPLSQKLSLAQRQELIDQYYRPHHARLSAAVSEELQNCGRALIVDCHSFPSKPLPYEPDQSPHRPDICIGTDDFHTPENILKTAYDFFNQSGYTVAINRPYKGTIVPSAYWHSNKKVASLMIEVNRKLYMDETTGRKKEGFDSITEIVGRLIQCLSIKE